MPRSSTRKSRDEDRYGRSPQETRSGETPSSGRRSRSRSDYEVEDARYGSHSSPRSEAEEYGEEGEAESGNYGDYNEPRRSRTGRRSALSHPRDEYGRFESGEEYDTPRSSSRRRSTWRNEDEMGSRRRGQVARSERAARARHDREGHIEDIGQGGWFGDYEAHSDASRRGWEHEHAPSGWFGDSQGHSAAARRGWDNPDHRPSGWFGDSEGHSRAARKGWGEEPVRSHASPRRRRQAA